MKFAPTFFRSNAAAPRGPIREPERGEAGADSEVWLRDLAGGGPDVNPELTGPAKFAVYDEMRKTDPTIKSILWIPKLTISGAGWALRPRDENEALDLLITDFVAWNLGLNGNHGRIDLSWINLTQQALDEMTWGAMIEELVWGEVETWRDGDGDPHLVRPLARLAPRLPATIDRFERNPDGSIKQVTQLLPGTTPMRGDKVTHMVFENEPGRWDGVSLLRPAWGSWRIKKALLISAGIGWDRFALGLPVVWHPDDPASEELARKIGRNIRSHERAYVHFPVQPGTPRAEAEWGLEIMNAASTLADPSPLIKLLSDQEAEAGLANFMRLGLGETGARATADAQANPFYLACEAIAADLARERTRQVVRRIVEVNFGSDTAADRCPRLAVSRIIPRDITTIAQALGYLSTAGFAFNDRGVNDDLRELFHFPKLPNDLEAQGISRAKLESILQGLGLDSQTFAKIVQALPEDIGLSRNSVPQEGGPLPIGA